MSIYQIIAGTVAVFMIANVISHFLRHDKSWRELAVWLFVWGSVIVVSFVPEIVTTVARITGFESGVNALVFFALVLLFYGLFRLVLKVETLEGRIVDISRFVALREQRSDRKHGALHRRDAGQESGEPSTSEAPAATASDYKKHTTI